MGAASSRRVSRPQSVVVAVVVNHDQLRRGEVGEVELTADVRQRLDKGYLRLADGETGNPLGGTPAVVPGPVTLLGVTPGTEQTPALDGVANDSGGSGNTAR